MSGDTNFKTGFLLTEDAGGGGGDVTDITNDYAVLREQIRGYYATSNIFNFMFNTDRSLNILAGATNSPSRYYLQIARYDDPSNILDGTSTLISDMNYAIGQSSMGGNNQIDSVATMAKDDSFVLVCGLGGTSGVHRLGIDPETYKFTGVNASFDTGIASPKKMEIIDASNYVNYDGDQSLQIFNFDGANLTRTKTIAMNFDIVCVNAVNGFVVVIGLSKIVVINPTTEEIVYTEDTDDTLSGIYGLDGYAFIKTLSSQIEPLITLQITEGGVITKLPLSVTGDFQPGIVKSLINVVKDDNVSGNQYIIIYHSYNASNVGLKINLDTLFVGNLNIGVEILTGTPATIKPSFISGNRMIFNSNVLGQPGTGYTQIYKYQYGVYSLRYKGLLFKIVGIGA
ncbi:MAG: hypothetical protein LBD46_04750 [Endomicrobium sp.]|jgi:hypothetical protein|nr:hypothetical protein [Endomicrobium sp.]